MRIVQIHKINCLYYISHLQLQKLRQVVYSSNSFYNIMIKIISRLLNPIFIQRTIQGLNANYFFVKGLYHMTLFIVKDVHFDW